MSNPIKHHFISQFYLRNFTVNGAEKEILFCYDKSKEVYFRSDPKSICFIKNFNTISVPGSEYIVETEQSKIEKKLAIAFSQVIQSKEYPSDEQLLYILNFMSLVSLRNPRTRTKSDKLYKDVVDKFTNMTMASEEKYKDQCLKAGIREEDILPYEKQKEFIEDKTRYTINVNQEIHVRTEAENISDLVEALNQRNWYLVVSDENIGEFITSDYPVSIISLIDLPPILGVGFGMKKTEVSFPISKYLALIGVFEEYENIDNTITATKDLVETINIRTYVFANKQVFSTHELEYNY